MRLRYVANATADFPVGSMRKSYKTVEGSQNIRQPLESHGKNFVENQQKI